MYKAFHKVMAAVVVVSCLCMNVRATGSRPNVIPYNETKVESAAVLRASGSFSTNVKPYTRAKGDTDFPMEAGETVRIYATYSPESANVDFGLVDPNGVFHYVSAENGSVDTTFEVPESGNYRLGIKNNSGQTVKVSGFVKY